MTLTDLTTLLDALTQRTNPVTGELAAADSCLQQDDVQQDIVALINRLRDRQTAAATLTESEITELCAELRALEYSPTVAQVARVLTGSRSIADPRLRSLKGYRRYRGVFTRRVLTDLLKQYRELIEGPSAPPAVRAEKPWRQVDFFDTEAFDKLTDDKATELYREVEALGLRKATDRLPDYMARARTHLPRAFEPWTREERALLIEAMCYTNDAEKLASIFGRSKSAVRQEGKRLIWNSQQRAA